MENLRDFESFYLKTRASIEADPKERSEADAFEEWADSLNHKLLDTLTEALDNPPFKDGAGEAALMAVGRFACSILEALKRSGSVREGVDIYKEFSETMMPVCRYVVCREMDDMEDRKKLAEDVNLDASQMMAAEAIYNELKNGDLTEEEVFEKYVKSPNREEEREEYLEMFREMRAEFRNGKRS